jgi:outer membrane protein assembly factor BamE (lipoprotein component of BamABCDE complex)
MKLALSAALAIAATAAAVALYAAHSGQAACEAADGKWASTSATCVTRECFKSQSCGEWAYPSARCNRLKVGDSRAEVYFQLGMPHEASSASASWSAGKDSAERVVAQFSGEVLASLSCPSSSQ